MSGGSINTRALPSAVVRQTPTNMTGMSAPVMNSQQTTAMSSRQQMINPFAVRNYNPLEAVAGMARQRPESFSVQNPFFGGAIPINFSAPAGVIPNPMPFYQAGSANRAYEAEQARIAAEKAAAQSVITNPNTVFLPNNQVAIADRGIATVANPQGGYDTYQTPDYDPWGGQFGDVAPTPPQQYVYMDLGGDNGMGFVPTATFQPAGYSDSWGSQFGQN